MGKRLIRSLEWSLVLAMALNFALQVNRYYFKGNLFRLIGGGMASERASGLKPTRQWAAEVSAYTWPPVPGRKPGETLSVRTICEKYPLTCGGRESIYAFLDEGDVETARKCLEGRYPVERFPTLKLPVPPTWEEDPYQERYWRFIFYSLRPTRDLLFAFRTTGEPAFARGLLALVESFIDVGMAKPNAWNDCHAAAFRTMVLVNTWWKLREKGALPSGTGEKILSALQRHGEFLMDPGHYDHGHNHGITESGALLVLATSFPDLPGASAWAATARDRLSRCVSDMVDPDGSLVENSVYYHFYAVEKFWEIRSYAARYGVDLGAEFASKLKRMIHFGTYVLQPDHSIPMLGASLPKILRLKGVYESIAQDDPALLYVLSNGEKGQVPEKQNQVFASTGLTILRSGWGKGEDFRRQTQVIFDYGPYRTSHSDLDGLNITLFGGGGEILTDSGLYSYERDPLREFFHGTAAHNTVVVDGRDQTEGSPSAGSFQEGEGFVWQSAQHSLYPGADHARAVALLGKNLVLVVDRLKSDKPRRYELLFQLAPDLQARATGLDVIGSDPRSGRRVRVTPLIRENLNLSVYRGDRNPIRGFQSDMYERLVPRSTLSYTQAAADGLFVTLLEIGPHDAGLRAAVSPDRKNVSIRSRNRLYEIDLQTLPGTAGQVRVDNRELAVSPETVVDRFERNEDWLFSRPPAVAPQQTRRPGEEGIRFSLPGDGRDLELTRQLNLNLADRNLFVCLRFQNALAVENCEVVLSTNHWQGRMSISLKNAFNHLDDTGLMTVGLGKGRCRKRGGSWKESGSGFDWSRIDGIRFRFRARSERDVPIHLRKLFTVAQQAEGRVSLVFDDGHWSVARAAEILKAYNLPAAVAVITERPRSNIRGYLNLAQLLRLKGDFGWDVVNHSEHHRNARDFYADKGDWQGLEADVLSGAKYLLDNGLNTAPNWYVYPFGEVDDAVEQRIGTFYKFARSVRTQPEVYPFGDPLAVKVFTVKADMSPEEIMQAVDDAREFRLTLLLVFHRLADVSANPNEYPVEQFREFAARLAAAKVKVTTLSAMDRENGVQPTRLTIVEPKPLQLKLDIHSY